MKKENIKVFLIMFITAIIMCSGFVCGHYSTDDYNIMNIGYNNYSIHNNLKEGRLIMYFIDQIYSRLNISYDASIISTVIIAIILACINIILVYSLIKKYNNKNNKLITYIILFSTIFNFMYIENLYFVESIVMSLSLVLYTLSVKYFYEDSKIHIIKAILLAVLATLSYNGLECYYISLICFMSLLKNNNNFRIVIFDILKAGLIILLSVAINYIQIKVSCNIFNMADSRTIRNNGIIANLMYMIYYSKKPLIETSFLFPKYLFIISSLILILFSIIYEIKKQKKGISFQIIMLMIICIASCYCIGLVSLSSFGTGRLSYGIGMNVGISLLYLLLKSNRKDKKYQKAIIVMCVIWTIVNTINYCYRTNLSKKNNLIEKQQILELDKEIKEYEKKNNTRVNQLVCVDDRIQKTVSDIDASALRTEWSSAGVINYYTGRNITKIEITKKQNENYKTLLGDKIYIINENKLVVLLYDK